MKTVLCIKGGRDREIVTEIQSRTLLLLSPAVPISPLSPLAPGSPAGPGAPLSPVSPFSPGNPEK